MVGKYFTIFIFILSACSERSDKAVQSEVSSEQSQSSVQIVSQVKKETSSEKEHLYDSLSFDSIRVNGLKFRTHIKTFIQKMGKPDSIVTPHYDCGYFAEEGIPVKVYYYKGSSFHIYRDTAELNLLDFKKDKDRELTTNKFKLSANTTLDEIEKYFPNSYRSSTKEDGNGNLIRVPFYCGQLQLGFSNGKLSDIEYWEPC
jgi:hypothetical protein